MRVFYFSISDLNRLPAARSHVSGLANAFSDLGCQVTLVWPVRNRQNYNSSGTDEKINVIQIPEPHPFYRIRTLWKFRRMISKCETEAGEKIVYFRNAYQLAWAIPSHHLKEHSFRIYEINNLSWVQHPSPPSSISGKFWRLVLPFLNGKAIKKCQLVAANTEGIAEELRKRYHLKSEKITVVHNAVDEKRFFGSDESGELLPFQPTTTKVLKIGFVGQLHRYYMLNQLILTSEKVCASMAFPIEIHIAGSGSQESVLRKMSNECAAVKVVLHGVLNHHDVPDFLRSCHVLFLGLDFGELTYDVDSLKLWEYLAVNRPILFADSQSFRQIVQQASGMVSLGFRNEKELETHLREIVEKGFSQHPQTSSWIKTNATWRTRALSLLTTIAKLKNESNGR